MSNESKHTPEPWDVEDDEALGCAEVHPHSGRACTLMAGHPGRHETEPSTPERWARHYA